MYQKQNFEDGDVLYGSQLNHIEDGIVALQNNTGVPATNQDEPTLIDRINNIGYTIGYSSYPENIPEKSLKARIEKLENSPPDKFIIDFARGFNVIVGEGPDDNIYSTDIPVPYIPGYIMSLDVKDLLNVAVFTTYYTNTVKTQKELVHDTTIFKFDIIEDDVNMSQQPFIRITINPLDTFYSSVLSIYSTTSNVAGHVIYTKNL